MKIKWNKKLSGIVVMAIMMLSTLGYFLFTGEDGKTQDIYIFDGKYKNNIRWVEEFATGIESPRIVVDGNYTLFKIDVNSSQWGILDNRIMKLEGEKLTEKTYIVEGNNTIVFVYTGGIYSVALGSRKNENIDMYMWVEDSNKDYYIFTFDIRDKEMYKTKKTGYSVFNTITLQKKYNNEYVAWNPFKEKTER